MKRLIKDVNKAIFFILIIECTDTSRVKALVVEIANIPNNGVNRRESNIILPKRQVMYLKAKTKYN